MSSSPAEWAGAGEGVPVASAVDAGYRLRYTSPAVAVIPRLDAAQQAVVDHPGGPLLVLAGPGTGKTTTLVESVAERVRRGAAPEQILVLTFSRRAAAELRDRIARRIGRSSTAPAAVTFHAFAYSLLAAEHIENGSALRVLSGPEQEAAVRELLQGSLADPRIGWPGQVRAAIGTAGLVEEVCAVLARVAALEVDLRVLAEEDPDRAAIWSALARFVDCYLDVLDARGMLDHPGLVRRAVRAAERPEIRERLRGRYPFVFVDEYQDVDPAQVRMLAALAGDGGNLMAFGDPDQAVYGFRGAEVRQVAQFGERFRTRDRQRAPSLALTVSRRGSPPLVAATSAVASRLPFSGLVASAAPAHRRLVSAAGCGEAGSAIEVATFGDATAEAAYVAETLRRAHLVDGLPWSQMAVLVRSGVLAVPRLRRALAGARVPVRVPVDEVPLRDSTGAAVLLGALAYAVDPRAANGEQTESLLCSPLGGLDASGLRALGRALRAAAGTGPGVPTSAELIRLGLAEPDGFLDCPPAFGPARALGQLLGAAAGLCRSGAGPHEVLWHLWSGTRWPERLERTAGAGGFAGARADRELDAVCRLFEAAERFGSAPGSGGVRHFLASVAAQRVASEPPDARFEDAVTVTTAHRAKGLEWSLVAVVGVQEGSWPDLRSRGSLLGVDRIGADGPVPTPSTAALLAEERRLFYVAVTRSRRRLLVTAVDGSAADGERPSRFLSELGVPVTAFATERGRALSAAALIGELRAVLLDPRTSPGLRTAAAARLAVLADTRDHHGSAPFAAAAPENWWGMFEPSAPDAPMRDPRLAVELSGSTVAELTRCPLRWFLRREVGAGNPPGVEAALGNVVHRLAEQIAILPAADLDEFAAQLDSGWDRLTFESRWRSDQQRQAAREMLSRLLAWQSARPQRTTVGVEVPFRVEVAAGGVAVRLRGRLDRVERDDQGALHVIDLKTSKTPVGTGEVLEHPQLSVYQLAVLAGAMDTPPGVGDQLGGAELVMLRQPDSTGLPRVRRQPALGAEDRVGAVLDMVGRAARHLLDESFAPVPSEDCDRCEFRTCCTARSEGRWLVE